MTSFSSHPEVELVDRSGLRTVLVHLFDSPDGVVDMYDDVAEIRETEHYLKLVGRGPVIIAAIPHHLIRHWASEMPSGLEGLPGEIAT